MKDCLELNRNHPGFSTDCKEEIDAMIERRVRDFTLDARLRKSCEKDIYETCAFYGVSGGGVRGGRVGEWRGHGGSRGLMSCRWGSSSTSPHLLM